MAKLKKRRDLHSKVLDTIRLYGEENGLESKDAILDISIICEISESLIGKVISGERDMSRDFLYRFVVGLNMSLEEADEFFALEKEGRLGTTNEVSDDILIDNIKKHEGIEVLVEELIKWEAIDKEEQQKLHEENKKNRGRPKKTKKDNEKQK